VQYFGFFMAFLLALLAVVTIIDVLRHHMGGWSKAGWIVLVLILPGIGSLIYLVTRRASPADAEQAYLAGTDRRHERAREPIDGGL
jgi:hypothetical protein